MSARRGHYQDHGALQDFLNQYIGASLHTTTDSLYRRLWSSGALQYGETFELVINCNHYDRISIRSVAFRMIHTVDEDKDGCGDVSIGRHGPNMNSLSVNVCNGL